MNNSIASACLVAGLVWLAILTLAARAESTGQSSEPIPVAELGAKAGAQYQGDGLTVSPTPEGARLHCVFQKLEGQATREGLWLTSTVEPKTGEKFRVFSCTVGREGALTALRSQGDVTVASKLVRFVRPGLTEEYSVSVDGVRQDFVIAGRPEGAGDLCVQLALTGARAEAATYGAKLTLDGSRRELAYSRLRVTDARGQELAATLEVLSAARLAVRVADATAVYPVRIDPTFSDADWISMGGPSGVVSGPSGANSDVLATAVDGSGNLYIGGNFTNVGSISANRVAMWNGSAWSALGSGVDNNAVSALAWGGSLYVGGSFTNAGGVSASRVAKWDGAWSALGFGVNNLVTSLAVSSSGVLYVGGYFDSAGIIPANRVAKWDGSAWSALGLGVGVIAAHHVRALAVSGGDLYVGGNFSMPDASGGVNVAKWNGSAWASLGLGSVGLNNVVNALAVSGSDLYVGGYFTTAFTSSGSTPANRVARWNSLTGWSALGLGVGTSSSHNVKALAASGNDLYVGGDFLTAGGGSANYAAKWNGSAWSALGSGFSAPSFVYALTASGSDVYVGGFFVTAGGYTANHVAKWNGSAWVALGSGLNSTVHALAVADTSLYVGGNFTSVRGLTVNFVVKWDGTVWSPLGSGMNNTVFALAVADTNLYAGGSFTTAGGSSALRVAMWNGNAWSALGAGVDNSVNALAVAGTNLFVGGAFVTAGGGSALRVAKWNGIAWSPLGSGLGNTVHALAVLDTSLFVGGDFTTAGSISALRVAKWNGSAWSALGAVGSGLNGSAYALAVADTNLYVGGAFTTAGSVGALRLARWNGSAWSPLGAGLNSTVRAIAVSGDDLYVAGGFSMAGGISAKGVANWSGSEWLPLGSGLNSAVSALALAAAGSDLYVGGLFSMVGGKSSENLAKANIESFASEIAPEIAVEQPAGTDLTDGSAGINFGYVTLGSSSTPAIFTITNKGAADLTGLAVTKDGSNAGDFTVGALGAITLAPGASTTFTATFTPAANGARNAVLHIASNDADENPFDITLTGTGPLAIQCAATASVECPATPPAAATDLASFVAQGGSVNGGCPPITVTHVSDAPAGTCPKTITRTYRATDACGGTAECTQSITVQDTAPPILLCLDNLMLLGRPGPVTLRATAIDNCDPSPTVTYDPPSGSTFPIGTTAVICRATDRCGNTATCHFNVTMNSPGGVYDGFDYAAGLPLATAGQATNDGGWGWSGPWSCPNPAINFAVNSSSLIPPAAGLPTSGGSVDHALSPGDGNSVTRQVNPIGTAIGESLWFSALVRSPGDGSQFTIEYDFGSGGTMQFATAPPGAPGAKHWTLQPGPAAPGPSVVPNQITLLVAEMRRVADTTYEFRLYVDPAPGLTPPQVSDMTNIVSSASFQALSNVTVVNQNPFSGSSLNFAFDELRIGRNYQAVTANKHYDLTLHFAGTGRGAVRVFPMNILTSADAVIPIPVGQRITLRAEPNADLAASFTGWDSECGGSSPYCEVIMNGPKTVGATFTEDTLPPRYRLDLRVTGSGVVRATATPGLPPRSAGGLAKCGEGNFYASYDAAAATTVTLTAEPDGTATSTILWDNGSTTPTRTVTMNADQSVAVSFLPILPAIAPTLSSRISADGKSFVLSWARAYGRPIVESRGLQLGDPWRESAATIFLDNQLGQAVIRLCQEGQIVRLRFSTPRPTMFPPSFDAKPSPFIPAASDPTLPEDPTCPSDAGCAYTQYYVDASTTVPEGSQDGTSAHPFKTVSAALARAAVFSACGVELLIAPGTYDEGFEATRHVRLIGGSTNPRLRGPIINNGPFTVTLRQVDVADAPWPGAIISTDRCGRVNLQQVAILRPVGIGVWVRGGLLEAQDLYLSGADGPLTVSPEAVGWGVRVEGGAHAVLVDTFFTGNNGGAIFATDTGTEVHLRRLYAEDNVANGRFGWGVLQAEHHSRVLVEYPYFYQNTHFAAVYANLSRVVARNLVIEHMVAGPVPPADDCVGATRSRASAGHGVMSENWASVDVAVFDTSGCAVCGVVLYNHAEMDLRSGLVHHNDIGACVQVDDYDLNRLSDRVVYRDNETNLAATKLPIPDLHLDGIPPP